MRFIRGIDSLRALAIMGVILTHWAPGTLSKVPWGGIGVHFFFVLSGFLITKILFESRIKVESENGSYISLIKKFYIRRALRIFPIYYLSIFVLLIFKNYTHIDFESALIYCLTYTTNFYFYKIGNWDGEISHLWSLAVEEQFYFIWPCFMILINKKYLFWVICLFLVFGLASEYFYSTTPKGDLLPNTCFDGFALGALLAWVLVYKLEYKNRFYALSKIIGISALILFLFILFNNHIIINIPQRFLTFLISLWILSYVVFNSESKNPFFTFIFHNPFLLFLGKISYGMYLYHFILPQLLNTEIINKYFNPHLPDFFFVHHFKWLFFFENFIILIIVSWLSYVYIETRFLNLKKHFNT